MSKVILYSTGCPKCGVLKIKMEQKHIEYDECTDTNIMAEKGFQSVPKIQTPEGEILDFVEAVQWIKGLDGDNNGN